MRTSVHLKDLLLSRGSSVEDATRVVEFLRNECPWFGGGNEVLEDVGIELLSDVLPAEIVSVVKPSTLVAWHNENARGNVPCAATDDAAYGSLVRLVSRFGREDGLGSGDYWVVEDLFSGVNATVMLFKPLPLPIGMREALIEWLNQQPFTENLTLVDCEGDPLLKIGRAHPG